MHNRTRAFLVITAPALLVIISQAFTCADEDEAMARETWAQVSALDEPSARAMTLLLRLEQQERIIRRFAEPDSIAAAKQRLNALYAEYRTRTMSIAATGCTTAQKGIR